MPYLGNGRSLLIYASNVKDDIIPDNSTTTFELSQEVPGGYEVNVVVVRRKYIRDSLVINSDQIEFDGTNEKILSSDPTVAAALSLLQPPIPNIHPGDNVEVSGAVNGANNGVFSVQPSGIVFDGTSIEIEVDANLVDELPGGSINLTRGFAGPWEILEPEVDYTISGVGPQYNRLITFTDIPQTTDVLYVIHRGDATYNFVPTNNSVGPDQLSQNLRNFVCDRFTGDGATDQYVLSQTVVNSKTLLVSVNGVTMDGDDPDQAFVGDWELLPDNETIEFHSTPALNDSIRVLHLGFSTISRRAALSPGQTGPFAPNSVTTSVLANNSVTTIKIDDGAVTNAKIANDAVDGDKILLDNDESLRAKRFGGTPQGVVKIDPSDNTIIQSFSDTVINRTGTNVIREDGVSLRPENDLGRKLGTASQRWSEGHIDDLLADTLNGTSIASIIAGSIPSGFIGMTATAAAPSGWLICDGSAVSRVTYANLFAAVGTLYGVGDGSTTFNLPNTKQRFLIGKGDIGTGSVLGETGGQLDHTHTGGSHTHGMASHTHIVPGHYHTHNTGLGSSLNITTSGNHTTTINIDHDHGSFNTSGATDGNHSHSASGITVSTEPANIAGNATQGSSHKHSVYAPAGDLRQGTGPVIAKAFSPSSGAFVSATHDTSTETAHVHSIIQSGHSHTTTGNVPSTGTSGTHNHAINVPALGTTNKTDTSGVHTHPTGNFTGTIGNVSGGVDGNGNIASQGPSSSVTDADGVIATTSNNPPYITFNVIIKT